MVKHDVGWLTAAPLWGNGIAADGFASSAFVRPAILRFSSDTFMDEAIAMLDNAPTLLRQCVAKPETWRKPMPKPNLATALEPQPQLLHLLQRTRNLVVKRNLLPFSNALTLQAPTASDPLKLYQPAQQRYYLLSATLVCKTAGLPDKAINPGQQEKASFVVRRIINSVEHAFVATGSSFEWQPLAKGSEKNTLPAEERTPLFNLNYRADNGRKRRLLAGLIPVAKREAYLAAVLATTQPNEKTYSPLHLLFESDVAAPWRALLLQTEMQKVVVDETRDSSDGTQTERKEAADAILKMTRESIQTVSWYILLDFAMFLQTYLNNVWQKIQGNNVPLTGAENALYQKLAGLVLGDFGITPAISYTLGNYPQAAPLTNGLMDALKQSEANKSHLDAVDHPYLRESVSNTGTNAWPGFLFPLTDPDGDSVSFSTAPVDNLVALVNAALPANPENLPGIEPLKIQPGRDDNNAEFVIRCVYEQPACEPLHPPVVSEPTEPFQMASFFDPDAPARPVRIPMPMDISPAGLRKYQKNTSLVISDMLCGKLEKIKKVTFGDLIRSVLPWPLHKDLPNVNDSKPCGAEGAGFGMICSLSIPIVTLVALILMIIMVTLFDIIFRWIPWLFTCLPIPGLKGKN